MAIKDDFWSITGATTIPAPADQVWEAIAAPGSLETCHPFVEENRVEIWPGIGAKDWLRYYSGLTYYREFYAWEEGAGYDLFIGPEGQLDHKVSWRVDPVGKCESTLTITVWPWQTAGWKKLIYWLPLVVYLQPLLQKYLASVVGGYRYFLTTGSPIPRNHFGPLRYFSPPAK